MRLFWLFAVLVLVCPVYGQRSKKKAHTASSAKETAGPKPLARLRGFVADVKDARTLTLRGTDNKVYQIRLVGLNVPGGKTPVDSPCADELAAKALSKQVRVAVFQADNKGNYEGRVWQGNEDIGLAQVRAGCAKIFLTPELSDADYSRYRTAQEEAKANQRGLWKTTEPEAKPEAKPEANAAGIAAPAAATTTPTPTNPTPTEGKPGRTYLRGPRGGCYYLSPSGRKVYVDRSICAP